MTELTTLARPYAVAAFKQARETNATAQWAEELEFLAAIMADDQIQRAMENPRAGREKLTESFLALCEGRIGEETRNFVRLLIQNHRLSLVGAISALFSQYKAEDEGSIDVDVKSAFELEAGEEKKLKSTLDKILNKKARLRMSVDRDLIGGVYIRAGDRVIDASVRGQLERLAKSLRN